MRTNCLSVLAFEFTASRRRTRVVLEGSDLTGRAAVLNSSHVERLGRN